MTTSAGDGERGAARHARIIALGVWVTLVAASAALARLPAFSGRIHLPVPPLYASWAPRVGPGAAAAVAVAAAIIVWGPRVAASMSWRRLVACTMLATAAWSVALALLDGADGITGVLHSPHEYLGDVPLVDSAGVFLRTFVDRLARYATHVQGHPPGLLLLLWGLDRNGLAGAAWAACLLIGGGAAAPAAVLVSVREVAGDAQARRAAPYVALSPLAIWIATSADALYAGAAAWGIALVLLATGRRDARGDAHAIAGGLLLGASAFFTYGVLPAGLIPLAVCISRRRLRPLAIAAGAAGVVALAFAAGGFVWHEGLRATVRRYQMGLGGQRPWTYFVVGNLGALAVAVGPAVAPALALLRDRRLWLLCGGGLAAVVVSDLSGLSKGEVERIWLPFAVWLLAACASLRSRGWLVLQAGATLATGMLVRSPW